MRVVLEGLTIGITADRRAGEQARMLEQRGAKVLRGPVLQTATIEDHERARAPTVDLLERPADVVIASTAIGIRTWLSLADGWGLTDELVVMMSRSYVTARGPKAAGALLAVGVAVDWRAPSAVLAEVVDHVIERGVDGRRVAVQLDGGVDGDAADRLRAAGADVVPVPTYRWSLPKDPAPAKRLLDATCAARVDAVTFTAAPAVRNLFALAAEAGSTDALTDALNGPVLAMCVGPVCRAAALDLGVSEARAPETARLGGMVKSLADELGARRRSIVVDGVVVEVQGSRVVVGPHAVSLAQRERGVFDVLARRPGAVVAKSALVAEVWGSASADAHALEVTVGRLRRRLAPAGLGVQTVARRGYRLTVAASRTTSSSMADRAR